jgi:hypothetical protein
MAESATVVTKPFYITTGRKNGFYTLRTQNLFPAAAMSAFEVPDNHVCTLAANEDAAIQKAKAYVEAFARAYPKQSTLKSSLIQSCTVKFISVGVICRLATLSSWRKLNVG